MRTSPSRNSSFELNQRKASNGKRLRHGRTVLIVLIAFSLGMTVQSHFVLYFSSITSAIDSTKPFDIHRMVDQLQSSTSSSSSLRQSETQTVSSGLPPEFQRLADRSSFHQRHCQSIGLGEDHPEHLEKDPVKIVLNNHTAHLPQFGIIDAVKQFQEDKDNIDYPYTCKLPPEHECSETQFTVIFMAYNPDRLRKMFNEINRMVTDPLYSKLVHEVVIVWNGERQVEQTEMGKRLIELTTQKPVRISYPLKAGFPNDLLNRYHPRLKIQTKAIMYYDDDGPFYSYNAILGGFELWKRNSNAQIGAMARKLDLNERQRDEKQGILNGVGDRFFVSHCPTDEIRYNFNEFANFGANMVLPSGSFLHSDYLCYLWHPIFEEIRSYVRLHPVNPDDGTVSILVSQLSGRAPKVYSRRINEQKDGRRHLLEDTFANEEEEIVLAIDGHDDYEAEQIDYDEDDNEEVPEQIDYDEEDLYWRKQRRRLMDGIDWDASHPNQHAKKNYWGRLRGDAANSLVRYFGSMNSGSIGWCYGTPYQVGDKCQPEMARLGKLPWLTPEHSAKESCP